MASSNLKIIVAVITVLSLSGCYTVLMTPQEFLQTRNEESSIRSDASFQLNYNQNCLSCHSTTELDDRYLELKYYGITTVHGGIALEPTAWNTPYTSPIYESDPYGWYEPAPAHPWWISSATRVSGGGQTVTTTENKSKVRTTGSTRDNNGTRERSQPNPAPTQATPSQPVGGTTSTTPSNPPPATTVTPQPATTTDTGTRTRTESKSSDGNSSRTRNSGSSRDSSSGNRPR